MAQTDEPWPQSLSQRVTLSKSLNWLAVANRVSFKDILWALRQGWAMLRGCWEAGLHPPVPSCSLQVQFHSGSAGHIPSFASFSLWLRSQASLLVRRKCWVFYYWPSFLLPPNLSRNLVFSQSTHILCLQEKEFFSSQGYIFPGHALECKHRPSWQYSLVEKV